MFENAVVRVTTRETPAEILAVLRSIEAELGKKTPYRFGPRTIDLDLLLVDAMVLPSRSTWLAFQNTQDDPHDLLLPHPRLHERRFVLEPLIELGGDLLHPVLQRPLHELLAHVASQPCERIGAL